MDVASPMASGRQTTQCTAWFAIAAIFFINGVTLASWISRIPTLPERLDLGPGQVGLALMALATLNTPAPAVTPREPAALPYALALPRPGESIGRYEIKRVIGVGGMGVVYEAHDTTLDRCVAVMGLLVCPAFPLMGCSGRLPAGWCQAAAGGL